MKITSVKIANFRQFWEIPTTIDIDRLTAIVGKNGEWKTSVLDAISYVTNRYDGFKVQEQDFNSENPDSDILIEVSFDKAFVLIIPDGYVTRMVPSNTVRLTIKHRERGAPWKAFNDWYVKEHFAIPLIYQNKTEVSHLVTEEVLSDIPSAITANSSGWYSLPQKNGNPFNFTKRVLGISWEVVGFPNVFYFQKNREKIFLKGYNSTFSRIVEDLNWRFLKKINSDAPLSEEYAKKSDELQSLIIRQVEDQKNERIVYPLIEKVKGFFGNEEKYRKLELSVLDRKQPFWNAYFSLRKENCLEQIWIPELWSWELIIIAYYLFKIVSELSREEVIFLIDEPELHLHPQAQEKLLREFHSDSKQIIYSTHSPLLIDLGNWRSVRRMESGKVYPLKETLDTVINWEYIRQHLDDISRYHQDKTVFFKEDAWILFWDKVLFAEGPAEKYGLPHLLKIKGVADENLSIHSCNGKEKLKFYQLVGKTFGIDYFTMFDLDGKTLQDPENSATLNGSPEEKVFHFSTSFEEVFWISATANHKASKVLEKIYEKTSKDILPNEIEDAIKHVRDWLLSSTA